MFLRFDNFGQSLTIKIPKIFNAEDYHRFQLFELFEEVKKYKNIFEKSKNLSFVILMLEIWKFRKIGRSAFGRSKFTYF